MREKGRPFIPTTIEPANSFHRLFQPLPVDNWPLTAVVRPASVRSGRLPWRSLQGSVTNRACSRSRALAKRRAGWVGTTAIRGNLASCLQAIGSQLAGGEH